MGPGITTPCSICHKDMKNNCEIIRQTTLASLLLLAVYDHSQLTVQVRKIGPAAYCDIILSVIVNEIQPGNQDFLVRECMCL